MKTQVKNRKLYFLIYFPSVVIALFLLHKVDRSYLIYLFSFNWIALLGLIILCLSPIGNRKLMPETIKDASRPQRKHESEMTQKKPFIHWFSSIIGIQLALFATFAGIYALIKYAMPILPAKHSLSFTQDLNLLGQHLGLFPWPTIILICVGLGCLTYRKNQTGAFSNSLRLFKNQTPESNFGLIVTNLGKASNSIAINLTITFVVLMLLATASHYFKLPISFGPTVPCAMTTMLFVFLLRRKKLKQRLKATFKTTFPKALIVPTFIGIATLLLIAINLCVLLIPQSNISIHSMLAKYLVQTDWQATWIFFASLWWFIWIPIMSIILTRLSYGYRIRSIILASLALPGLTFALIHYKLLHIDISQHIGPYLLLGIIGSVSLLLLVFKQSISRMLNFMHLPDLNSKSPYVGQKFLVKTLVNTTIVIYLYMIIGLNGVIIYTFANVGVLLALLFYPGILGLFARTCRAS